MPGKLILVVDDEEDIVEIVSDLLRAQGYRTAGASNGEEALAAIAQSKPDGIVLDIKMPGMDGVELLRRLRQQTPLACLPVVVLTATQLVQELRDQLDQLAVSGCIAKPFEPAELLEAVGRAVR